MIQTIPAGTDQTIIFTIILVICLLLSLRPKKEPVSLSLQVSNQLKGFAILTILFGHIGYFLFSDHNFLFPLSTISGVGVDLFFLLSGFGLAISSLQKNYSPIAFYQRRIGKIFIPLWLVLTVFFASDWLFLHHNFDWQTILRSFLGFYPQADIYNDLNSPLWYLTPLLSYYLLFPLIFKPRFSLISAIILALLGYLAIQLPLPVSPGVLNLYQLHYLAFPLGVALASFSKPIESTILKITKRTKSQFALNALRYFILIILTAIFYYTFISGGETGLKAQLLSILSATSIVGIFILTKLRFQLLELFGKYSYEIYLFHWPLLLRYDFIYHYLPAGLGTACYLIYFLTLAYFFQKITALISTKRTARV